MSIRHIAIILLFGAGAAVAAFGLFKYYRDVFRQQTPVYARTVQSRQSADWIYLAVLFLILIIAFLLRLEGIDLRGMSHVEVYIPGIKLPPLISEPPPRTDFFTMLSWHWHDEPHPQAYYILMFFWTKLFGTSLLSIRFPSVVFGVGAVALVYVLASMAFNRRIGLVAAALLALNGHHIYWSQNARMYAMACFLGLASAILLLQLLKASSRRPRLETGYVIVTFLGLFTQLFFWVLLAAQMLLALVYSSSDKKSISRIFSLQVLVVILGSPLWAHAVYRSRQIDLGGPTMAFIQDFVNFGFLYLPDYFTSSPPRDISQGIELVATGVALVCLLAGFMNRSNVLKLDPPGDSMDAWRKLVPVAAGFALIILALSMAAWRRQGPIAVTALVPLLALLSLPAACHVWPRVTKLFSICTGGWQPQNNSVIFFLVLGMLPAALLILVSLFKTMMIARGFMLFVPFLLVIMAAGVETIGRKRVLLIPLAAVLLVIHAYSIQYYRGTPGPNDYRGLAQQMTDRMHADDLVFVYPKDWATTPLFFYFQDQEQRLIGENYAEALAASPSSRVWLPLFAGYKGPSDEMREALQSHVIAGHISAHKIEADLYVPAE